jgi:predicted lipoprotein
MLYETTLLWSMLVLVVWTIAVSLCIAYRNRPKKCHVSYAPRKNVEIDEALQSISPSDKRTALEDHHQRLVAERIRPTTQHLRQAQQCMYQDIRQTCGPHTPRTSRCYNQQLHKWRKIIHQKVATGEYDAEILQLPLYVSEAHNIVLRKEDAYD